MSNEDENTVTFKIKEFDPDMIAPTTNDFKQNKLSGSKIIVIGKPNTGKSTLIASLLYKKKHIFPTCLIQSGSEDTNGFYKKIVPSTFIYNSYNEDAIKKWIRRQKLAREHLPNPWSILLLDDCTDSPAALNTTIQQSLFKKGRHFSCLYILSLQYCLDVKPFVRTNVDYVFILRNPILKDRKSLYENFCSIIPTFQVFCALMDQVCNNFTALVIKNSSVTNDWTECVYWYKADLLPKNFVFGSKEFIDFHNARYNPDFVETYDTY